MLSVKSIIKVQVNGKDYEFFCDPNSSLQDALEANSQINAFILGRMEQAKNTQQTTEKTSE